ncbi:MAG: CotH kinase family protein [Aeromicrobium sp.]
MRRTALVAALVLAATSMLVSCGSGPPAAPTSSVKVPLFGQKFTLSGDIGEKKVRTVELQVFDKEWKSYASGKTKANGTYSFSATTKAESSRFRVVAPALGGSDAVTSDAVTVMAAEDKVSLGVYRLGSDGEASGKASPTIKGREFALQVWDDKQWKQIGDKATESSDGTVKTTFKLNGKKPYRLVAAGIDGSPGAKSATETFAPGPKSIGRDAIYVTTDSRKDPTIKGQPFKGKALIVSDGKATRPLDLEEITVRGNSTADKVKHPYKLKFDHKQSPFGFAKDKTWLLLANFGDWTLVRTAIGFDIGQRLDGLKWTPKSHFAELYVNGTYKGSYELIQSIKIDKDRVNIDEKKGVVIEIDPHFKRDGVPGFRGDHHIPYAFKDPDERKTKDDGTESQKGITDAKVAAMKKRILGFEKVLYGPNFKDPKTGWTKYLDIDSAVDYYLVKEFTKENDGDFYRSNFFHISDYTDPKAKFFMGPVWDFDRSAGAKPPRATSGTTVALPTGWWLRGHGSPNHSTDKTHWYVQLTKDPVFLTALKDRWKQERSMFKDIADNDADRFAASLGPAPANDRALWGTFTDRYEAYSPTHLGEIAYLKGWFQARFKWIDGQLK